MYEQKSSAEHEHIEPNNICKEFIPSSTTDDVILRNICRSEDFKKYNKRKRFNSCRFHLSRNEIKKSGQSPVVQIRNSFGSKVSNTDNNVHLWAKNDRILNLSSLSVSEKLSPYCSTRNPIEISNSVGDYHKFSSPIRNVLSRISPERQGECKNVLDKNILAVRILNNLISSILPSNDRTSTKLNDGFVDESYKISIAEIRDVLLIVSKKISELQELDSVFSSNYLAGLGDLSKSFDCQHLECDCDILKLINDIYASKLDFHFSNLSINSSPSDPSESKLVSFDFKKRLAKQRKFCKTRIAPKFIKVRKSNLQKTYKKRFVGLSRSKYQQHSYLGNSGEWMKKKERLLRSYKNDLEYEECKKRSLLDLKHSIRKALSVERNLCKVNKELERTFEKTAKLLKLNRMKYSNCGQQVSCEERNNLCNRKTVLNTIRWQPLENEVNLYDGHDGSVSSNLQSFSGNNNIVKIPKEPRTFLNGHKTYTSCRRKTISHFRCPRKTTTRSMCRKNDKENASKATTKQTSREKPKTNFIIKNRTKYTKKSSLMKQTSPTPPHKSDYETYNWTVIYDSSVPNIRNCNEPEES